MALGRPLADLAQEFNSQYKVTLDLSGWSQTTIQAVAPVSGAIVVYASNDSGAGAASQGDAGRAGNFSPVLVTNLATGTTAGSISAAGNYKYSVDAQFLRLQGSPSSAGTSVYKLLLFNSKVD